MVANCTSFLYFSIPLLLFTLASICLYSSKFQHLFYTSIYSLTLNTICFGLRGPSSGVLLQIFNQDLVKTILIKHQIIAYFRYVGDILIIYDPNKTNIIHTLNEFNKAQPTINFTMEKEEHQSISFLDLVIHRNDRTLECAIYRKPTQTDIIPISSCHPMNTNDQAQNTQENSQNQKSKWRTLTYSGKEVRKIKRLFRDTKIKLAFSTQNTIQNILKPKSQMDKYNRSGIYQIKCLDCPLKYAGQTGRTFKTRYKEHIHDIKSNNSNSGYSSHILNTGHRYGTLTDTVETITTEKMENI
ncbi:hypothetical protein B7P43_G11691 [Cryptotermes secundus]|uniref:Reverse transcriptase domain-containing protein n=1 Tax=Cryptotermes secundus TaxID=105785 RepID=A0A2J7QX96_9NEOP|nr:hypothetical protein B7P43_G11691 [Cryptotermes secundus]